MELDELKKMWKGLPQDRPSDTNIVELIQNKNNGPLASLKKTFRRRMRLMIIVPVLLLATNFDDTEKVLTSILFWAYIFCCLGIIWFARHNFKIVQRMQAADAAVKVNLQQQIALLEKRMQLETHFKRIILLFLVLLVEVVPYFQYYSMLDKWHSLPVLVRSGSYAGLLLLQFLLNKKLRERRTGEQLAHLKELVQEME
ncbi:MAG TPA: hypothetical protein VK151_00290 [Fluviicola sp.]|nr:hypothetical protein [Fluviicola sp.]